MKRILTVLALAALMAAVLVAAAVPAFAVKGGNGGGADVFKFEGCSTGVNNDPADDCQSVITPSGKRNVRAHDQSDEPGPSGGGGATVQDANCINDFPGKARVTPSGNTNVNCGTRGT